MLERAEGPRIDEAASVFAIPLKGTTDGATGMVPPVMSRWLCRPPWNSLKEDPAAFSVDRIGHGSPADDMLGEIDAGCAVIGTARDRDRGGFSDQEAARRSALPVDVRHHWERCVGPFERSRVMGAKTTRWDIV